MKSKTCDTTMPADTPIVQMQHLRPAQIEARARAFPAVYVPFGPIEWHGPHLPVGNDALKAEAVVVRAAQAVGGLVYPPVYFHEGFDRAHLVPMLSQLFARLKAMGFRVLIGVSGHNVDAQIEMVQQALAPVVADGTVAGIGLWEVTLSWGPESQTDHAAKWETANMLYLYPHLVEMAALPEGPMNLDMQPPWGIGGLDPREHATAEVGRRNVELAAAAIGRKAQELLAGLPEEHRHFRLPALRPGEWWMI